uniref:Dysbindin protein homolog n=1 Tax=Syphacia muris TaxID=451379 RepID=A0A0N5AMA3_9BILA
MFEAIRDALTNVQNEISTSVQRLRGSSISNKPSEVIEALSSLVETQVGSSLLLKFQLCIEQMEQMNDENIRLANLASTRLGTLQQMCNERSQCTIAIHDYFRSIPMLSKQLKDVSQEVEKLNKFCQQTEQAITYLEGLHAISFSEEEIRRLKANLKKEKDELTQQEEHERIWMQDGSTQAVRYTQVPAYANNVGADDDEAKNQSEVTILEQFLSS